MPALTAALGLGAASLGNLYRALDDDTARAIVERSWSAGFRRFDTAPHYGIGLSERRLGAALRQYPREEFTLSTKVGRVLEPRRTTDGARDPYFDVPADATRRWDFSADGVRRSLDDSLERLGLDRVDTVYLHDPEDHLEQAITEALPALVALRDSGVITAIGVGSKDTHALTRLLETGALDRVMVAGRYTLLEQPALGDVFPSALRHGTSITAVGIYNSGILASAIPDPAAPYEYGTVPPRIFARVTELAAVCTAYGTTLPHAALQFAQRHPQVSEVFVGLSAPSQVEETQNFASELVPDELWQDLAERGLIPGELGRGVSGA